MNAEHDIRINKNALDTLMRDYIEARIDALEEADAAIAMRSISPRTSNPFKECRDIIHEFINHYQEELKHDNT